MKKTFQKENLNPEIQTVKRAMNDTKDLRLFKRYQAILKYLKEQPISEIAAYLGCSEKTVYNYVNAYKVSGLAGLIPGESIILQKNRNKKSTTQLLIKCRLTLVFLLK